MPPFPIPNWIPLISNPQKPGSRLTLQTNNWVRILDLKTGESKDLFKPDFTGRTEVMAAAKDGKVALIRLEKEGQSTKAAFVESSILLRIAIKLVPSNSQEAKTSASLFGRTALRFCAITSFFPTASRNWKPGPPVHRQGLDQNSRRRVGYTVLRGRIDP